jgi:signal transduction histidine kinase/CheY-like chemotaxis protein
MKSDLFFGLENACWPVLLTDGAGVISRANRCAMELFRPVMETASCSLSEIWSPENSSNPEQFLAYWELSPAPAVPVKFRVKAGEAVSYLASICLFAADAKDYFLIQLLPERAPALAQTRSAGNETTMVHRQKLECALQLARTVSLDFNNALTSILGHTSLVLSKMEPSHPWRESLLEVEKSAARAAEIANDLGAFSRQEKEVRPLVAGNLNLLLQRSVEYFKQNPRPDPISWTWQLERNLFPAKFEEAKMQQVFMRIIENALEAITGGGRISLQTRNIELSEPTRDCNVRLDRGAYVYAEISDSGGGIKPELLPRIFEPFFTTKGGEKHRGLGLAWVYGIVTNHGGRVAVSSQPGAGASVRIYLPAEQGVVRESDTSTTDLRGAQTVLVVDDEEILLTMGHTILTGYGYRVLTANSGQKALEILSREDAAVDLIITDLVMPAMSGRELVEHIHRISPAARIICTSGCVLPAGQENNHPFLQKPFTSKELLLKVKQELSR